MIYLVAGGNFSLLRDSQSAWMNWGPDLSVFNRCKLGHHGTNLSDTGTM